MKQQSLASQAVFENYGRKTWRGHAFADCLIVEIQQSIVRVCICCLRTRGSSGNPWAAVPLQHAKEAAGTKRKQSSARYSPERIKAFEFPLLLRG
jgi:hypothetical protein